MITASSGSGVDRVRIFVQRAFLFVGRGNPGDLDSAISDATEAIKRTPADAVAFALRAAARIRKIDLDRAFADVSAAARIAPGSTTARSVAGQYYLARGNHDRALAELNEVLPISPTNAFAKRTRGLVPEKAHAACGSGYLA